MNMKTLPLLICLLLLLITQISLALGDTESNRLLISSLGDEADIWCEVSGPFEVSVGENLTLTVRVWANEGQYDYAIIRFLELSLDGPLDPYFFREPIIEETNITAGWDRSLSFTFRTLNWQAEYHMNIEIYALLDIVHSGTLKQVLTLAEAKTTIVRRQTYSQLYGNYTKLNEDYDSLNQSYYSLNQTYRNLQQDNNSLKTNLNFYQGLTIALAIATVVLVSTTVYFVARKTRTKSQVSGNV